MMSLGNTDNLISHLLKSDEHTDARLKEAAIRKIRQQNSDINGLLNLIEKIRKDARDIMFPPTQRNSNDEN